MKEVKSCAFQYAVEGKFIEDTDLITLESAKALFRKHINDFVQQVESGHSAEIAIWQGMSESSNYHSTYIHLNNSDKFEIVNGKVYMQKLVEIADLN